VYFFSGGTNQLSAEDEAACETRWLQGRRVNIGIGGGVGGVGGGGGGDDSRGVSDQTMAIALGTMHYRYL
jgi:hypothetical protein